MKSEINSAASNRRESGFVWFFLLACVVAGFSYVVAFGRNVPSWDEWDMVPTTVGVQPVNWEWLWSQHNEHRIPLPRLVMLAAYRLSGDFRSGMLLNVAGLAAAAVCALNLTRKRIGRLSWTDLFIPLTALNLGQGLNFMWGWQLEFVISTLLALGFLVLVLASGIRPRIQLGIVTLLMVLLTGSGAHGLVLVPALVLWVLGLPMWSGSVGSRDADRDEDRVGGGLAVAAAVVGVVLIFLYLHGYEKVPYHPTSLGLRASVRTAIKALTMSFGPAVRAAWPWSGLFMVAVLATTFLKLGTVFAREPAERLRAWGLMAFLLAICSLAAALGLGRDGFEPRYVTLLFPLLWGIYFVWRWYGSWLVGGFMRVTLTLVGLALLWPNTRSGLAYGKPLSAALDAFAADVRAGQPAPQLIARYGSYLHPSPELLTDYFPLLRKAGWGVFSDLRGDPEFERLAVKRENWQVTGASFPNSTSSRFRHDGQASILIATPADRILAGVEFRYAFANEPNRVPFIRMDWRERGQPFGQDHWHHWNPTGDRANWESYSFVRLTDRRRPLVFWIWRKVDEIRIQPDFIPGEFDLHDVTLVLVK